LSCFFMSATTITAPLQHHYSTITAPLQHYQGNNPSPTAVLTYSQTTLSLISEHIMCLASHICCYLTLIQSLSTFLIQSSNQLRVVTLLVLFLQNLKLQQNITSFKSIFQKISFNCKCKSFYYSLCCD
jgi:hypothetical protein